MCDVILEIQKYTVTSQNVLKDIHNLYFVKLSYYRYLKLE